MDTPLKNKRVLITGGSGSLGTALLKRITDAKSIRVISRSEIGQDTLRYQYPNVEFILCDIRDKYAVRQAVKDIDIIIHAAAFKYLDLSEVQPRECVLTNIIGTLNIIEAAKEEQVEQVIGISTDKASYACNVYGCTKQIMERLLEEAGYIWVRYGNVIGTNGSVIPRWKQMVTEGKDLMVTSKKMRRFFFSIDEAIDLIFKALKENRSSWAYMKVINIWHLAEIIADGKVDIFEGNLRPGEKIDEVLVPDYEGPEYSTANAEEMSDEEIKELIK